MESTSEAPHCVCQTSGCGCNSPIVTVSVTPTTGGQFQVSVLKTDSIESLKKLISKKLKVPKERICLLHRERQLREGTVEENQVVDGSRLTLLPSVETGLLAQRPEQSVMQALESLNDSQVNDFLSGKAPLNLTMRLGDHMMLIQLQLSTVAPGRKTSMGSGRADTECRCERRRSDCGRCDPLATTTPTSAPAAAASVPPPTLLDTRALAEASRNLTQTLKQLSSEVLTSKSDDSTSEGCRRQGAIIESMHHHGKGVYSGTFSGTLNPALQDKFGRPKRDISTIIHILNDLLCATPQYRAGLPNHPSSPPNPASPSSSRQTIVGEGSSTVGSSSLSLSEGSGIATGGSMESLENRATRGKMERLRLVLGQRRERRRAMRSRPYAPASPAPPPAPQHSHTDSVTA